jgi:flagellar biosynthesis protein FliQ
MDAAYFTSVAGQALWILVLVSAPVVVPALVIGIFTGMLQAATSINEQTLSFVPKLLIVLVCLALFGGMMMGLLMDFTQDVFSRIPDLVR